MTNKITYEELNDPSVDELLQRQQEESAGRAGADTNPLQRRKASLLHRSWFNLMLAGALGAFVAWAIIEPHFQDSGEGAESNAAATLLFPMVATLVGLMIGGMEGFLARNYRRALKGVAVGLGVGLIGGFLSLIAAGLLMIMAVLIGAGIVGQEAMLNPTHSLGAITVIMVARSLAWAAAGSAAGLGPGLALKSRKLLLNGFLGGLVGGLIGGLIFDPLNYFVSGGTFETGLAVSRGVGLTIIGGSAGLMIGLVELMTRDAWLQMTEGPLRGKQFTIYKDPTLVGSSPKCDVYLFKDAAIEPFHASISAVRDGFEMEDRSASGSAGVLVNGRRVSRQILRNGDTIGIGSMEFTYSERERSDRK